MSQKSRKLSDYLSERRKFVINNHYPDCPQKKSIFLEIFISKIKKSSTANWFIHQIQRNAIVSAKDIAGHWKVSERTAKRDITDLKQKKVIAFSGAAKNGSYHLLIAESDT
ncbi:MAG: HTH domain-containing protein [Desulfobacula sp.]|uniref:DeoR family transcriptional regulator n=1 Tax=Desulfobacula sp. TaxID=2593537 RepID=UPI001DA74B72|nr:HTH domain-containing protein [Desulfobacula sp.]MBT3486467.1 HTH domain-containing protein [Desulfobacula sp.]MBT3806796.1 HTH domain-containing protein [Desulfobacula sp.]MBT4027091.1 HTH domain-containing protein [Desulfobacula sp.]MBT4197891.1 HTH domain-containing protein [Desulfobacula sp.]